MKLLFISAVLAIGSAHAAESYPVDEAKVRSALDSKLKDSESARLKNLAAKKNGMAVIDLCGDVNAKNSYGAYSGYERFYGVIAPRVDGADVYAILGIGSAAAEMCRQRGL
ncbi:hypothetical protein [Comamonas testosteroni]|uniref:hypothetical protein n=1 Tax=Comamonas testosteroni TaxID=285 RepID=UPI0039191531